VAEAEWHPRAERQEHLLSPQQADALAARLGHSHARTHGATSIPMPKAGCPPIRGNRCTPFRRIRRVVFTHIEDEPVNGLRPVVRRGFASRHEAFVIEKSADRIRFWRTETSMSSAPVLAGKHYRRAIARLQNTGPD
jgi:hypothetical protein